MPVWHPNGSFVASVREWSYKLDFICIFLLLFYIIIILLLFIITLIFHFDDKIDPDKYEIVSDKLPSNFKFYGGMTFSLSGKFLYAAIFNDGIPFFLFFIL